MISSQCYIYAYIACLVNFNNRKRNLGSVIHWPLLPVDKEADIHSIGGWVQLGEGLNVAVKGKVLATQHSV